MDQTSTAFPPGKAYNRAGFAYLVFLAGLMFGAVPLSWLAYFIYPAYYEGGYAIFINYAAMYLIGFPLMLLVFRTVPNHPPAQAREPLRLKPLSMLLLYAVCFAIVGVLGLFSNFLNNAIGELLGNGYSAETVTDLSGQNMVALFVCGVIIAPAMEEIIFRGIAYRKLGGYGQAAYILVTSLIFGLFHLNLGQFFYATVLGLLFAKITWDTGTVRYSIILHIMVNMTGGVGFGSIVARYGGEKGSEYYGWFITALMAVGGVAAIVWCVRNRGKLRGMLPERMEKGQLRRALLSPGNIVYYLVCLLLIVSTILTATF